MRRPSTAFSRSSTLVLSLPMASSMLPRIISASDTASSDSAPEPHLPGITAAIHPRVSEILVLSASNSERRSLISPANTFRSRYHVVQSSLEPS